MTPPADGLRAGSDGAPRCWWCAGDPLYERYHDTEWGFPVVDDRRLFEKLCLEGFQSGLSWLTILRKRPAFRAAFADFDIAKVARFGAADVARLLGDAAIVRHRGKIEAAIHNATAARALIDEAGSLAAHVWRFEPKRRPRTIARGDIASTTAEATALAKDLKKRGFRFVGPTTAYAFMQAMGLVDDHLTGCHVRPAAEKARAALTRPI